MLSAEQRKAVVNEARSWVGTPYCGHSCRKGLGVDCGQLIYGVYRALRLLPALTLPTDYSLQVAKHRVSTEYMEMIDHYFRAIPEAEAQPGDLVCYQLGLAMAHAGIIVRWPDFILQAELRHGVSGSHGINNPSLRRSNYLQGTVTAFRTLRDEYCKGGF